MKKNKTNQSTSSTHVSAGEAADWVSLGFIWLLYFWQTEHQTGQDM